MTVSQERDDGDVTYRVREAHDRLEDHAEMLDHHDRRISVNENWRLQAQGAIKVLALILGGGVLAYGIDVLTSLG